MSKPLQKSEILFRQRVLSCCGLYTAKLDGIWGPITDSANVSFEDRSEALASQFGELDPRSERNIRSLRLKAQELCRRSILAIRAEGLDARVISGARTYDEQNALFRKGRYGNPGPRVTNARAGRSWHNFCLAWDIGIFDGGKYLITAAPYDQAGAVQRPAGVEWGGNWKSFKDRPHYQAPLFATDLKSARAQFESGAAD